MERYALIIGISSYQSSSFSRLPKAKTDAEKLAQILEQYGGYKVFRLPQAYNNVTQNYEVGEADLNGAELGKELEDFLLNRANHKEDVLIYFAGHGFTAIDILNEQKGFLATSNCQVQIANNQIVEQRNGISLESLNSLIRKSSLRSLVLLLDCCHSGYFLERQLVQQTLTAFSSWQRDYYLITACRSHEEAKSLAGESSSIFTGAIIEGLSAFNADQNGCVSGDRLFDYVSSAITRNHLKAVTQEPIRMGWGRVITLVSYAAKGTSSPAKVNFNPQNPYLGLLSFESDQSEYFGGREEAIRALLDRIDQNRFVAVIGSSGCGKSSLVKAGLVPYLKGDRIPGSCQWVIEQMTPGEQPEMTLLDKIEHLQKHPVTLLLIDQGEEVFTLCKEEEQRQRFFRLIAWEAATQERQSRIIFAIRGDFLDRCAAYTEIAELINRVQPTTYCVEPLTLQQLQEAIIKPAQLHGVEFEHGLALRIAEDAIDRPGALPLLQYALRELWRVCIEESDSPQPLLTWEGYQKIGRVGGALVNRANNLYDSASESDQVLARRLCLELVEIGEGEAVTRRRVARESLEAIADSPEQLDNILRGLARHRLIVLNTYKKAENEYEACVEVAHEALLSQWGLLKGWIEENRDAIRLERRFEADYREWIEKYHRSEDALLTGARLATFEEWEKEQTPRLSAGEKEFLQRSREKRDREQQAERQKVIVKIVFFGVIGLLAFVFLGYSTIQANIYGLEILTKDAKDLSDNNNQLESLIKSVEALNFYIKNKIFLPRFSQRVKGLENDLEEIVYGVQEHNRLGELQESIRGLSITKDGKMVAAALKNGDILICDTIHYKCNFLPKHHTDEIWNIAFGNQLPLLASAGTDKEAILWNWKTQQKLSSFRNTGIVYGVGFSKNDTVFATSNFDGIIKVQRLKQSQINQFPDPVILNARNYVAPKFRNNYSVLSLAFHPYLEEIIAYGGDDKVVWLWNWKTKRKPIDIIPHQQGYIYTVKFSPNGKMIAASSQGGSVSIWSMNLDPHNINQSSIKLIGTIQHEQTVNALAFTRDSKYLASGGDDELIKIWQVDKLNPKGDLSQKDALFTTIKGHTDSINQLEFEPLEGKFLLSASSDKTVRVWDWNKSSLQNPDYTPEGLRNAACEKLKDYFSFRKTVKNLDESICSNKTK